MKPAVVGLALAFAAASGCGPGGGSGAGKPAAVPVRAETAGDALMRLLPAGADVVAEIDVARLRDNALVAPLIEVVAGLAGPLGASSFLAWSPERLRTTDAVVIASYGVGRPDAGTVVLVLGTDDGGEGRRVADNAVAYGPAALIDKLQAVVRGQARPLTDDVELLRVRTEAMPEKATGAAVRVAARLDFNARVKLSASLVLDEVPATLSMWGDVADDMAIVTVMSAGDAAEAKRLVAAVEAWRDQTMRNRSVRRLGLRNVVGLVRAKAVKTMARALLVVGPTRFSDTIDRLMKRLRIAGGKSERL